MTGMIDAYRQHSARAGRVLRDGLRRVRAAGAMRRTLLSRASTCPIGRSYPYRATEVITRVTVANPAIADAVVISEREIVVNAAATGEGDIILWLQSGARVHFRIQVHTPADRMQIALAVKFAEVRRDALRELGVSGLYRDKNVRVGTGRVPQRQRHSIR